MRVKFVVYKLQVRRPRPTLPLYMFPAIFFCNFVNSSAMICRRILALHVSSRLPYSSFDNVTPIARRNLFLFHGAKHLGRRLRKIGDSLHEVVGNTPPVVSRRYLVLYLLCLLQVRLLLEFAHQCRICSPKPPPEKQTSFGRFCFEVSPPYLGQGSCVVCGST